MLLPPSRVMHSGDDVAWLRWPWGISSEVKANSIDGWLIHNGEIKTSQARHGLLVFPKEPVRLIGVIYGLACRCDTALIKPSQFPHIELITPEVVPDWIGTWIVLLSLITPIECQRTKES